MRTVDGLGEAECPLFYGMKSLTNQINGINWANDFDFAATLSRLKGP